LIQGVLPQLSFSYYRHRSIRADFCGGEITSDAGLLPLRGFDQRHHLTRDWAAPLSCTGRASRSLRFLQQSRRVQEPHRGVQERLSRRPLELSPLCGQGLPPAPARRCVPIAHPRKTNLSCGELRRPGVTGESTNYFFAEFVAGFAVVTGGGATYTTSPGRA
jgi:hypothetical protein